MKKNAFFLMMLISTISLVAQTSRTWTGSTSTDWNTANNWSPSGVPSSTDHIVLNTASGNQPILDANRSITNITVSAGTIDLNGYVLTVTGTTSLTGGTINNGTASFNNTTTTFSGTTFGAAVNVTAGAISAGGTTFNGAVTMNRTGSGSTTWNGGNIFNSTFDLTLSSGSLILTSTANNNFNDNITFSNTGNGSISMALSSGISYLASGKTISIGSGGFASGSLIIANLIQSGTTAQSITTSGTSNLTIGGCTINGALTITGPTMALNNNTFNGAVSVIKNGSSTAGWTGGNTFNSTFDLSVSSGGINLSSTSNNSFNDNVTISNTGSGTIALTSNNGSTYLASGKTIGIGSGGFASGSLSLGALIQSGSTPQSITTTGTSSLTMTGCTTNGAFTITAPSINLTNNTFNGTVSLTKNGSSSNSWGGSNTFNSTFDISLTDGSVDLTNWTNGNNFNDNVTVSNTGSGVIRFMGHSATSTLASGKTIIVGSGGFTSGTLNISGISQTASTAQTFITTGTSTLIIAFCTFGGSISTTSPSIVINNSTFNGAVSVSKNGSANSSWSAGNTFNSTLDIIVSNGGLDLTNWTNGNTYNDNVTVSNTGAGVIRFMGHSATSTLASGKTITVGSGGFASGTLSISGISQTSSTAQTFTTTGTSTLNIAYCTFAGAISATAPTIGVNNNTFNGVVTVSKNGSSTSSWGGANIFNSTLNINVSNGGLDLVNWTNGNNYNGNITISNTGNGTIRFNAVYNTSTIASGKTISIGTGGFTGGNLYINGITQSGSTAQNITLTGTTATLYLTNSTFNGAVTASAPNVISGGSTFNSDFTVTKSSSSTNSWTANTYNGNVSITNTGTGYINTSVMASGGDVYNANATFTKSGSGDVIVAGNASTVTFKGDVTMNNISSAQFTGSQVALFTGTNSQTLNQSGGSLNFGRVTINKASNNLTLSCPITVSTALTLTSGKVLTTGTNILNLADNATVSGASNSSYVQGPVKKTGNDAFTFPTGKSNYYRPIGIAAPTSAATVFTAEYLDANQTLGSTADTSIANLSDCEHWTLTRSGSSDNVNVTLSWNSASCNGAVATNMRVAGWNGSQWTNYGNGARTGTANAGTVTSGTTPTTFNAYALGNKNCTSVATITPSGPTSFCSGGSVNLSAPAGGKKYTWLPSGNIQTITASATNSYIVKVADSLGCVGKDTVDVTVWANPTANAGTDKKLFVEDTITIGASPTATGSVSPYSYDWSPGIGLNDSTIANPLCTIDDTTIYTVVVTDAHGCTSQDAMQILGGHLHTLPVATVQGCEGQVNNTIICFEEDLYTEALADGCVSIQIYSSISNPSTGNFTPLYSIPCTYFTCNNGNCCAFLTLPAGNYILYMQTHVDATDTEPEHYKYYSNTVFSVTPVPEITDLNPVKGCIDQDTYISFNLSDMVNPFTSSVQIDWGDGNSEDVLYTVWTTNPVSISHQYTSAGTYTVTITAANSDLNEDGTLSCSTMEQITVTIFETCCFGPDPENNTDISFGSGITLASDILANAGGIYSGILGTGNGPGNLVLTTNYTGIPTAPNISTATISINGTFIVDIANVTFDAAHITLGPNARIEFAQSGSGTKTLTINDSWLHACDYLWDGIYVRSNNINTPTRVLNVNSSLVEDAKNAVVSERCGDYNIVDSRLNKNYKHIVVQKCTGYTHPSQVTGTIFECDATLAPASPALPGNPSRTNICIEANEQLLLNIGSAASSLNYFHQSDIGVFGNISSLTLKNNTFENYKGFAHNTAPGNLIQIQGSLSTAKIGTAVYAYGNSKRSTGLNVIGNAVGTTGDNIFIDCTRGIFAYNNIKVSIIGNQFNNGFNAIYIWHCVNNNIFIRKNQFDFSASQTFGTTRHGIFVNNFRYSAVSIANNTMVFNQTSNSNIAAYHGTGITVRETNLTPTGSAFRNNVKISNNIITEPQVGIRITNTSAKGGAVPPDVDIYGNRIDVYQDRSTTNAMRYGIFNEHTRYTNIHANWLSSDFCEIGTTEGIRNQSSTGAEVYCNYLNLDNTTNNTINQLYHAITFNNTSTGSHFYSNQMQNAQSGVRLALSGNTANQYSVTRAQDNQWFSDVVDFPLGTVYSDGTDDGSRNIYIWPGSTGSFDPNFLTPGINNLGQPGSVPFNPVFMSSNPNNKRFNCEENEWEGEVTVDFFSLRAMARQIAADSVNYPCFAAGSRYSEKTYIYNLIKEYPDSMLVDSTLNSFYAANTTGNMGILWAVDSLMASYMINLDILPADSIFEPKDSADYYVHRFDIDTATVNLAETTLLTATPINRIEQANYTVNMAVIHALQRSIHPDSAYNDENIYLLDFSPAEWDSLNAYAYLCAYEYGPAVYKARILLAAVGDSLQEFWESYINPCEVGDTIWARTAPTPNQNGIASNNIKLYPNPTNGNVYLEIPQYIEYVVVEVISSNGQPLQKLTLTNKLSEFDMSKYSNGLYFVRIFDNNGDVIDYKKLSLIR